MRIKILGKIWELKFTNMRKFHGECQAPTHKNKTIKINNSLKGEKQLEIIVHEVTHAAFWHLDEVYVKTFGEDLARILTRLGYGRSLDKKKVE